MSEGKADRDDIYYQTLIDAQRLADLIFRPPLDEK
jgi:hypothetical protein